jgi:hypothetical protein
LDGLGLCDFARDDLIHYALEFPGFSGRPHQGPDVVPSVLELPGHIASQIPGGTGDEDGPWFRVHSVILR